MADWITQLVNDLGAWAVVLLMFLENIVPPIPSELVMPLAGFVARTGQLSFPVVVLAGTVGSLAGTLPWYFLARWLGERRLGGWIHRHGRWVGVSRGEFRRAMRWFSRHQRTTVLLGRLVPGVRTLISVPAGFAAMPLTTFLTFSAIGTLVWTTLLAWLGWLLGRNYEQVDRYLGPVSMGVIASMILWWLYRVVRKWFSGSEDEKVKTVG